MKVICDRGALVESLGLVGGVVVARTPKPVLTCVKLTAGDPSSGGEAEGLVLEATDTEVSVRLSTPRVEVAEPGSALIPADKLQQIVRESIDPTLTLSTEQDVAHITGQDSKFKIFGHPPADFPATTAFDGDPDFTLNAGDLHRLIAQTLFATARENSRYAINGVLVERTGNKLAVVATDGHRLALARGTCKAADSGGEDTRSAIVPTKALNLLLRLFDDAEQTVSVRIADNQIAFKTDDAVLVSNLVEGNFPPYADVIPKDGDKKASLATDLFVSAVRRAALLTNEESKGVRMAFAPEGLTLSSRAPEMGEAEVHVEMPEYSGEPVEIGFNPAYLLDALKVVDESQVHLELKGPNKPGVLRTGPNFLYVVMPVNLQ
ncbi:MAG: DNA polymerase III subunit beta [Planctomycetota bacterium]